MLFRSIMAELIELVEVDGRIDITGVNEILKGDVLCIDGQRETVLDLHEATDRKSVV